MTRILTTLRDAFSPNQRVRVFIALALLLACTFGVATWRTTRDERGKVKFMTCIFAADASRVLQARSRLYLEAATDPIFGAVGGRMPVGALAPLPSPLALRSADRSLEQCHCAPHVPTRGYFRLDIRPKSTDGDLTFVAADSSRSIQDAMGLDEGRVRNAVLRLIPYLPATGVMAGAVTSSDDPADTLRAVAVINPKYDTAGQLRAVYGVLIEPRVFASQVVASAFKGDGMFAAVLARQLRDSAYSMQPVGRTEFAIRSNAELANLAVLDSKWTNLYQSGPMADAAPTAPGCMGMSRSDPGLALLMLHISPTEEVYDQWVQSGLVEAYLPFLALIVVAMLASVIGAALSARRETELAKLRSDVVSSASHELRMPLAQILMSGETLRRGRVRTRAEHDAEADSIVREAQRLSGLVDNALFFSRIEHHNLRVTMQPTELRDAVAEAVQAIEPLADGADMMITSTVQRNLSCLIDKPSFRQVVYNLIENAIKYGRAGQEILVGADIVSGGDQVQLWVDDQGPGVPPGQELAIFDPFVRLERDRESGIAGSGLGLAVVRHIIELHDGRIWVERSRRGRGSRFVVTLRVSRSAPVPVLALAEKLGT
jgi:signal transduction histidine kinase